MAKNKMSVNQALELAGASARKGDVQKARKLYSVVLASFPNHRVAKKGLRALEKQATSQNPPDPKPLIDRMVSLYSGGRLKEALIEARRLSLIYPDIPFLHSFLGTCYSDSAQPEAAVKSYQRALQIKPDYVEVHNHLGAAWYELGKRDEAAASFNQALVFNPDYAEAHHNLGNVLRDQENLLAAAESYRRALRIRPDNFEAHNNLGSVLRDLEQADDAVASYQRALDIKPDYFEAMNNLGNAFKDLEKLDTAVMSFKRALEIKPDYEVAHNNLGLAYRDLQQLDKALESHNRALEIKPDFAEAHYNLGTLESYQPDESRVRLMRRLLSGPELNQADRIYLGFALAGFYDKTCDHDRYFEYLNEANRLRKKDLGYDFADSERLFSSIRELFSKPGLVPDAAPGVPPSNIQPVFIVGMPRSGTSLVEQILASHSRVHGAGELGTFNHLVEPLILKYPGQPVTQHDTNNMRTGYLEALTALNVPEKIITDKMPNNFTWIGFILSAFPCSKIINLNRDSMATCWSIYKHNFTSKGNGYAYNMLDLGQFYGLYTDLMSCWRERFPNRIYDIHYERLTENQEYETRNLLEYCELDWQASCLDFHKTDRIVATASAMQVKQKMYKGSSEVWKKYAEHLQPLMKTLDYY